MRLTVLSAAGALLLACQQAPAPAPTVAPAVKPTTVAPAASPAASPAVSPVASPAGVASPAAVASPSPAAAARVVTIETSDYAFNAPDTIQGGLVTIQLRNIGREPHHAQFMRLNTNVTLEQFLAALAQGPGPALQLASLEGGPAAIDAGGSTEVTLDIKEGQYVMVCFVESPDGVPHLVKGMVRPFRVTAAPVSAAAPIPSASGTVTMKDFTFELPASIPAGRSTLRVVNEGPQPHEMAVVRLATGKTVADLTQFFSAPPTAPPAGPPPFAAWVGGMQGLETNGAGFAQLELQAGEYAAICLIPDPGSGRPHIALGMSKAFTAR